MAVSKAENDRLVMYLLGVVAVLLVALVAIIIVKSQATQSPVAQQGAQQQAASGAGLPGVGSSTQGEFDPKTATKVPAKMTPEEFVKTYYQAILDKKWDVAFKMQPARSQANGTVKDFEATQLGYGMKSFKLEPVKVSGDAATVVAEQSLPSQQVKTWFATWTFVKFEKGWVVKQREISMGGTK